MMTLFAGSKFYNLLFRVKGSLPTRCISESYIKTKINLNLYFHISLWYLKKGFMKAFKAFTKTFEEPQGNMKIKI